MNRIGITLLILISFLTINVSCQTFQNFFWSHHGGVTTEDTVTESCIEFALLYNWYTTQGTGDLSLTSSDDWSVPTTSQADALRVYAGGYVVMGKNLGDTSSVYWNNPEVFLDTYGFSGVGSGWRNSAGSFQFIKEQFNAWVSDTKNYIHFSVSTGSILFSFTYTPGMSVRLVSDATGIADGTWTTYTGNNNHVYNAVAINELYWTEPLIETQLRNGSLIPFHGADNDTAFTNAEWAALTTAGVCAYGNNLSYVGCDFEWPIE